MIFEKIAEFFAIIGLMLLGYGIGKLFEFFYKRSKKEVKKDGKNNR